MTQTANSRASMSIKPKLIVGVASTILVSIALIVNPFNLFLERSSRFNPQNFERVREGMSADDLVDLLGAPVQVRLLGADYWMCPGCSAYCFMGNPPDWLVFYKEAWVYVGPDKVVRKKFFNTQP
jgi:hypothetical protein